MTRGCVYGQWRFTANTEPLETEPTIEPWGQVFWAQKANGVIVTRGYFNPEDAVGRFLYHGANYKVQFSSMPIIAEKYPLNQNKRAYIDYYLKTPDLYVIVPKTTVLGTWPDKWDEMLEDVQDPYLYDCLFDGPVQHLQDEQLKCHFNGPLVRRVENLRLLT